LGKHTPIQPKNRKYISFSSVNAALSGELRAAIFNPYWDLFRNEAMTG
jgi:hypothetical protein